MTSQSITIQNSSRELSFLSYLYNQIDLGSRKYPKEMVINGIVFSALGLMLVSDLRVRSLVLSSGIGLVCKTAWNWKHLANHMLHDICNFSYAPKINHRALVPEVFNTHQLSLKLERNGTNQELPVLKLPEASSSPSERGFIQGYLFGKQIFELKNQVLPLMVSQASSERDDASKAYLKANIVNLNIPRNCSDEMQEIAAGYRKWAQEMGVNEPAEEVEKFLKIGHILTDTYKAIGSGHGLGKVGCSTIAFRDPSSQDLIVGRLLDWVSLGKIGETLYIKSYCVPLQQDSMRVYFHTFPGFIGGLTCWNDRGVVAIVNELGITTCGSGTPYNLFVKEIIEQSPSVDDARKKIIEWQADTKTRAASSFTLTIADAKQASTFYFYPSGFAVDEKNELKSKLWGCATELPGNELPLEKIAPGVYMRSLNQSNDPLIVTNHAYLKLNEYIENSICDDTTQERLERICKANKQHANESGEKRMEKMLRAAGEMATIAAYVFNVKKGKLRIGNDNYNAAALLPQMREFNLYL